jgi:hypothetical protein
MSKRASNRWVGGLALVLALTASRHNFPLRQMSADCLRASQTCEARTSTTARKSEGVVPSRRHRETRQAEWVKTLALTPGIHPLLRSALERHNEFVSDLGARRDQSRDRRSDETSPGYLLAFLPSQPSRALPPPA